MQRSNLNVAIITGHEVGGQLMTTTEVENWPGDPTGLLGPDLMERMQKHATLMGAQIIQDHIERVELAKPPFKLFSHENQYSCNSLIIATGASARYLGLPSEKAFMGRGVSACATCDGFFYRDLPVAVVGGGNTAITEALYLATLLVMSIECIAVINLELNQYTDRLRVDNEFIHKFYEMAC